MLIETTDIKFGDPDYGGADYVCVVQNRGPDVKGWLFLFEPCVLAWRAMEYDLDVEADRQQIIDMLLHEPFEPPEPPLLTAGDLARARDIDRKRAKERPDGLPIPSKAEKMARHAQAKADHELRLFGTRKRDRPKAVAELVEAVHLVVPAVTGDDMDAVARAAAVPHWLDRRGIKVPTYGRAAHREALPHRP